MNGKELRRCSTPFGITAFNTINALITLLRTDERAQRLSASLHSTHQPTTYYCGRRGGMAVLNAFRHNCIQHRDAHRETSRRVLVLNAFRHHCIQQRYATKCTLS
ncbi:MAG: hypothetical protein NZU63_15155 [Gemmataceae bacterium]|nr:hypothetical protein [Gemmataceae bacterium]MDW8244931.1 hypothetical protein [Thermogemmata sp.]